MSKLTATQRKVLEHAAGLATYLLNGRAEHGAWASSEWSCKRRGWIVGDKITEAGRAALHQSKEKET